MTTRLNTSASEKSFRAWLGAMLILVAIIGVGVRWSYDVATTSQDQVLSAMAQRHGEAAAPFVTMWRADHLWPTDEDLVDLRDLVRAYDADPSRLATVAPPAADPLVLRARDSSTNMLTALICWPLVAFFSLLTCLLGGMFIHQSGALRRRAAPAGR